VNIFLFISDAEAKLISLLNSQDYRMPGYYPKNIVGTVEVWVFESQKSCFLTGKTKPKQTN
jgi:hypothetical protein